MAGYVIHMAVAQEYLRKNNIPYSENFIRGSVLPDLTKDKSKTHYGKSPAYTNLYNFLKQNELESDTQKGIFMHLITDYLFYNYYLDRISKPEIYDDYDISNNIIIEKYNVKIIDEVKDTIMHREGELKILSLELIYRVIDEVSNLDLEQVKKEALENSEKWNYYKKIV